MKMNRKDINIKPGDITKELSRELNMRWAVYARQVNDKKLSKEEANKRYLIILELKELMEAADAKGISIKDLKEMVANAELKAKPTQGSLFTQAKFPN